MASIPCHSSISCHSFVPYPIQKKLLDRYLEAEGRKPGESSSGKREGKYDKELEEEPRTLARSELQEKSMEDIEQIHSIRQGLSLQVKASKSFLKEPELQVSSRVRIYDASAPYVVILDSRTPKLKSRDQVAKDCFKHLQSADKFYRDVFEIRPVHVGDQSLVGYIHDRDKFNNACWNGSTFRFGDVDPDVFRSMMDIDIVTHEVGHAVITSTSRLYYQRQSGALNESIADIFAIVSKHFSAKTDANAQDADWDLARIVVMGEGQYAPLRSFRTPGKAYKGHPDIGDDMQVASMTEYVHEPFPSKSNDWGGVHTYSGIPNHAFYLAATRLQGPTWGKIGKVWFEAIMKAKADDDFATFAHRTIVAAKSLKCSERVQSEIQKAWRDVGIIPSSCCTRFIQSERMRPFLPVLKNVSVERAATVAVISVLALLYKQYY